MHAIVTFVVFIVVVIPLIVADTVRGSSCVGCPDPLSPLELADLSLSALVRDVLHQVDSTDETTATRQLVSIVNGTRQVVSGVKYDLVLSVERIGVDGEGSQVERMHVVFTWIAWEKELKLQSYDERAERSSLRGIPSPNVPNTNPAPTTNTNPITKVVRSSYTLKSTKVDLDTAKPGPGHGKTTDDSASGKGKHGGGSKADGKHKHDDDDKDPNELTAKQRQVLKAQLYNTEAQLLGVMFFGLAISAIARLVVYQQQLSQFSDLLMYEPIP